MFLDLIVDIISTETNRYVYQVIYKYYSYKEWTDTSRDKMLEVYNYGKHKGYWFKNVLFHSKVFFVTITRDRFLSIMLNFSNNEEHM
jgi:hypothetical protein